MRLDEMIINANEDGKTYTNSEGDLMYSKNIGFLDYRGEELLTYHSLPYTGWQEKPARRITVSEAEKELDCVIDVPDISKLFKLPSEITDVFSEVILVNKPHGFFFFGHYDFSDHIWRSPRGSELIEPTHWINPADLIKLLPKE